jgi:hypothetical protein
MAQCAAATVEIIVQDCEKPRPHIRPGIEFIHVCQCLKHRVLHHIIRCKSVARQPEGKHSERWKMCHQRVARIEVGHCLTSPYRLARAAPTTDHLFRLACLRVQDPKKHV